METVCVNLILDLKCTQSRDHDTNCLRPEYRFETLAIHDRGD